MTKTFDQSLIDTCVISMSMLDKDDIISIGSEEFETLRREQQGCHNDLTNREDYPFKVVETTITTQPNVQQYTFGKGKIKDIYIKGYGKLVYSEDIKFNSDSSGQPTQYRLDSSENIILFPIPDQIYNITVEYIDSANVLDSEGNEGYIITTGSTLKMPERLQHLYFDALEYYLLATHIKKNTNPRYQPTVDLFKSRWTTFLSNCTPMADSTRFII